MLLLCMLVVVVLTRVVGGGDDAAVDCVCGFVDRGVVGCDDVVVVFVGVCGVTVVDCFGGSAVGVCDFDGVGVGIVVCRCVCC